MIEVICPNCLKSLQVPEEHEGQTGKCRHCGGPVSVPYMDSMDIALPAAPQFGLVNVFGCLSLLVGLTAIVIVAGLKKDTSTTNVPAQNQQPAQQVAAPVEEAPAPLEPAPPAFSPAKPQFQPQPQATQEKTVYVTASGERYHGERCRTLRGTSNPVQLSVAKSRGYTPCGVCRPGG